MIKNRHKIRETLLYFETKSTELKQEAVIKKHTFDFSCFRIRTNYFIVKPNGDEWLVAYTTHQYVLEPDSNQFQGKIGTTHYLTDVVGEVDLIWQNENPDWNDFLIAPPTDKVDSDWVVSNPTWQAHKIRPPFDKVDSDWQAENPYWNNFKIAPPLGKVGAEDYDAGTYNHVVKFVDEPVYEKMTDGEIGTLAQKVREQMIQVLMLTIKDPTIKAMVINIIKWYKTDYDLFVQTGYTGMLDSMKEDIDNQTDGNQVNGRYETLTHKPFELIIGHPYQHNSIYDNIKARFDVYDQFVADNS